MASSNTINDFYFDLQMSGTFGDNFQFVDALTLLKNPESLNVILKALLGSEDTVDLNKDMSARQALWAVVALNAIDRYTDLLLNESGSRTAADRLISKEVKADFPFLRRLSDDASWQSAISLISRKMARPSVDEFHRVLKSIYNTLASSKAVLKSIPDFKNQILLAYPRNTIVDNFDKMSRRYVTSGAKSFLQLVAAPETPESQDFPMVAVIESDIAPKGSASVVLIGFNDYLVGSGGSSTFENSATQGAVFDASARLQSINIPANIIDPSAAQKKQIFEVATEAVKEIVDKDGFSQESAAEMLQMAEASARILLDDPSSPYHGKGYTEKDVISIASQSMLGTKGQSALLKGIASGLESCISRYKIAEANLLMSSDSGPFSDLFFESQIQMEQAVEDYDVLLSYASILYDIDAPSLPPAEDPSAPRKNPGQVVLIGLAVAAVAGILYWYFEVYLPTKANEADLALKESQKTAIESAINLMGTTLGSATSIAELDSVFEMVKGGETPRLIKGESTTDLVDCQKGLRKGYAGKVTFEEKQRQLALYSECLSAQAKALGLSIERIEKVLADLRKRDPARALMNFFTSIGDTATSVAKIALYTALGLGALWGGVKVYRSLKSDSDQ